MYPLDLSGTPYDKLVVTNSASCILDRDDLPAAKEYTIGLVCDGEVTVKGNSIIRQPVNGLVIESG